MIVVVGEALVDLVIDAGGDVTATLGGAPFNTARACGRLGADVALVGSMSTDRFGTLGVQRLLDDRVTVEFVQRTSLPTTLAAAELDDHGGATYRFYVAGTAIEGFDHLPQAIDAEILFTGGLALVLEPMAEVVERMVQRVAAECMVMIDVNCRPAVIDDRTAYLERLDRVFGSADVVKVSDEDLAYLQPGVEPVVAARSLLEKGPRAVLLTAGGVGVTVITAQGEVVVAVAPVAVVDTIGAGDSFSAGFLTSWAESGGGRDGVGSLDRLVPAVEAATAVAGAVCTRRGADPPWRSELSGPWALTQNDGERRPALDR